MEVLAITFYTPVPTGHPRPRGQGDAGQVGCQRRGGPVSRQRGSHREIPSQCSGCGEHPHSGQTQTGQGNIAHEYQQ